MRFGVNRNEDSRDLEQEVDAQVATRAASRKVRLSMFTWEGLAACFVLLALCIVFAGDEPSAEDGSITLGGHFGMVETVRFSPDGGTAITSSWDRTVRIWDVGTSLENRGKELACLPSASETYSALISPDGGTVVAAGLQGLTTWNWRDGESFPKFNPTFGPCRALAFSPDGLSLAVGGFDRQIRIWEPKTARVRAVLSGHNDVLRSLAFVPDGSLLVSLSFDGSLKFWDMASDREIDRLDGRTQGVHAFSISPDGERIALSRLTASASKIEVWNLPKNVVETVFPGHPSEVHALAFSPDGRTLVSAGGDQEIRFWDAETGVSAGKLDRKIGWVRSLDFSKDGRWLAYSGSFSEVYLKRVDLRHSSTSTTSHHS